MANEKRLIDANALLEVIDKSDRENFHKGVTNRSIHHYEHRHFMSMVLDAPTVDAVEVKHGRWKAHKPDCRGYTSGFVCSCCGDIVYTDYSMKECI